MIQLICTGDDFGASPAVNEAIEQAHRAGVLTAASLMVAEPGFRDAVERAKRLPEVAVGLHLSLVDGKSKLPPRAIPDLVDSSGHFGTHLVSAGFRFFFLKRVRQQLRAEVRAQFEAFAETGLTLDHVNTHHHMHLHPTLLAILLEVGKEFGLRAVRLPQEPYSIVKKSAGRALVGNRALLPWVLCVKWQLKRAGVFCNDYLLGLSDTGKMSKGRILSLLAQAPQGVVELYAHPATEGAGRVDFEGLCHPAVREKLSDPKWLRGGFLSFCR